MGFIRKNTMPHQIYRQFFWPPPSLPASLDLSGKTAFISGSNTGLGFEAARLLLDRGLSTLIMGVRTLSKGEKAKEELIDHITKTRPHLPVPDIQVWELVMDDYGSVRRFVARYEKGGLHFDMAILNAAIIMDHFALSPNGHETTIATNYLGTALLTLLLRKAMNTSYLHLLSSLKDGAKTPKEPVVEVVGSGISSWEPFPQFEAALKEGRGVLEYLDDPAKFTVIYAVSKLLGHLFFHELVRRLGASDREGNKVVLTLVCPGLNRTSLAKYQGLAALVWLMFINSVGNTAAVGARNLTWGAAGVGKEAHGVYLSEGRKWVPLDIYETERGEKAQRVMWEEMVREFERIGVDVGELLV